MKKRWARPIAKAGIHPNLVSLAAVPVTAVAAYWCSQGWFLAAGFLAIFASLFDFVDGEVARMQGRESNFGNYLETLSDRMVETCLFVGLATHFPRLACLGLALAFLVSYAKTRVGLVIVTDNRDWPGIGDHSDRMVLVIAAVFFAGIPWLGRATLALFCTVTLIGFIQRLFYAKRLIEEAESKDRLLPYLKTEENSEQE